MEKYYPNKINDRFNKPKNAGVIENADANGKWASFLCGVSVRFSLCIDSTTKEVTDAKFKTNGCGFVVATADFICEVIKQQELTKLHGLDGLERNVAEEYGEVPADRSHCLNICFDAIQKTLAEHRDKQIEEWTGEKALICSCFGVSEERIENEVSENNLKSVSEVGDACNAGIGCGSCQPLIQEIIDLQVF